ncbi:signal recognition particle-docking protein FtsY [Microvirga sp. W0021]|uniref:Signal recognition particle receptor FtsY n=1 Tax=Hohaiivirga grylli TaxID=3133970 RepID=A0ABV0BIB1_9HYPH
MAEHEEKKGFLSRLFGRKSETPVAQENVPVDVVEAEKPDEQSQETTQDVLEDVFDVADKVPDADLETDEIEFLTETIEANDEPEEQPEPVAEEVVPEPQTEPEPQPENEQLIAPTVAAEEPKKLSWWQRLTQGMRRTSSSIGERLTNLFTKRKLDAATIEDLEDILVQADLGVDAAIRITDRLSDGRFDKEISPEEVKAILADEVEKSLQPVAKPLVIDRTKKPYVILMVGVNGSGKTTTIGKLAAKFKAQKLSVMLAAGDTFRAAAIEQLKVWGERNNVPVVATTQGADAAGLAFDALQKAQNDGVDVLMIDTAGRLQNKAGLMDELEKIVRVIKKVDATAPHSSLLVLDATVGQNALSQVELFGKTAGVTGLIMTKLDGTARGGILVAVADKFSVPVHFIGVGEGVDDLEPFEAKDFARAIAGLDDE